MHFNSVDEFKIGNFESNVFLHFPLILSLCCNMYIGYTNIIHREGSYSNILHSN
jgi:hypothetical protein